MASIPVAVLDHEVIRRPYTGTVEEKGDRIMEHCPAILDCLRLNCHCVENKPRTFWVFVTCNWKQSLNDFIASKHLTNKPVFTEYLLWWAQSSAMDNHHNGLAHPQIGLSFLQGSVPPGMWPCINTLTPHPFLPINDLSLQDWSSELDIPISLARII